MAPEVSKWLWRLNIVAVALRATLTLLVVNTSAALPTGKRLQFRFPALDLRRDILGRRSADRAAPRKRIADIENLRYIMVEAWRKLFNFRDGDLIAQPII